ncbi:AAEL017236-PA [Aedes aegypti]|uniref:Odorant receptor 99 n=2 Tax=Aedes aegypti TaxID=7159 RepID=J9EBQ5_AEDAE|nr:AAEL017236-PA [Aedes aegypti]DAA80429.1 TPA_exp: odorant receptor 99 [Aedes aegypti]
MSRAREYWYNGPPSDCFKMLNVLQVLAGNVQTVDHLEPNYFYSIMQFLLIYAYGMTILKTVHEFIVKPDSLVSIWCGLMTLAFSRCLINGYLLKRYNSLIKDVLHFICNNPANHVERIKFRSKVLILIRIMLVIVFTNQIIMLVPSEQRDRWFSFPSLSFVIGHTFEVIMFFVYTATLSIIGGLKYWSCAATVTSVVMGLKVELIILVQQYEEILKNVQTKYEAGLGNGSEFWNDLTADIYKIFKKHQAITGNIQLIRPLLEAGFFVLYYCFLLTIGALLYVVMEGGISASSSIIALGGIGGLFECYWWTSMVDSMQETNELFGDCNFQLLANIGYDQQHRAEIKELQKSLMIFWITTSNPPPIKCMGMVSISILSVVNLVNNSYSMLTFLIEMGSKRNV